MLVRERDTTDAEVSFGEVVFRARRQHRAGGEVHLRGEAEERREGAEVDQEGDAYEHVRGDEEPGRAPAALVRGVAAVVARPAAAAILAAPVAPRTLVRPARDAGGPARSAPGWSARGTPSRARRASRRAKRSSKRSSWGSTPRPLWGTPPTPREARRSHLRPRRDSRRTERERGWGKPGPHREEAARRASPGTDSRRTTPEHRGFGCPWRRLKCPSMLVCRCGHVSCDFFVLSNRTAPFFLARVEAARHPSQTVRENESESEFSYEPKMCPESSFDESSVSIHVSLRFAELFAPSPSSKRQRRFAPHSSRAPGLCSRRRTRNCSVGPAKGTGHSQDAPSHGTRRRCALDPRAARDSDAVRDAEKNLATDTRTDGASNFQPTTTAQDALPEAAEVAAVAGGRGASMTLISSIRSAPGADPRAAPRVTQCRSPVVFSGRRCGGGRAGHVRDYARRQRAGR